MVPLNELFKRKNGTCSIKCGLVLFQLALLFWWHSVQDIVTWVQDCLSKLQNRTADILRIRGNPVLYRWDYPLQQLCWFSNSHVSSSDTWEYELSHVLDIYTDDFIHRSIVSLTQWQDIPQETKMKAFEMLVSFVSRQIERMGPHSIRSSTYGLSHDNLNLNYRSCQRAGRIIDFTFVQNASHLIVSNSTRSSQCQHEQFALVSSAEAWRSSGCPSNGRWFIFLY